MLAVLAVLGCTNVFRNYSESEVEEAYNPKAGASAAHRVAVIERNWRSADGEFALHFYARTFIALSGDGDWIGWICDNSRRGTTIVSNALVIGPDASSDLGLRDAAEIRVLGSNALVKIRALTGPRTEWKRAFEAALEQGMAGWVEPAR